MRYIVFEGMWDVESFNLFVRSRRDNAPDVVLLVPEGCTSSKLPARLDGEVSLKTKNAMLHVHRFT